MLASSDYYPRPSSVDIVEALLRAGADVNATANDGRTAVMLASSVGAGARTLDIVEALLRAAADVNATAAVEALLRAAADANAGSL